MPIAVGDTLPDATFNTMTSEGVTPMSTAEVFTGRKVVVFGVPGAFTPTCQALHLPGFVANAEAIRAKGVDTIACISVNDIHVLTAWAKSSGADQDILFLADGSCEFTEAADLVIDLSFAGMGKRSVRYAMIVDDRRVVSIHLDTERGVVDGSSAETILSEL